MLTKLNYICSSWLNYIERADEDTFPLSPPSLSSKIGKTLVPDPPPEMPHSSDMTCSRKAYKNDG